MKTSKRKTDSCVGARFEVNEFRLSALIKQRATELSYDRLAIAIARANSPATDRRIDRRKLKKLVEDPENVVLNMRELRALDTYFGREGEGLADKPIFERVGIVQSLASRGEVTVLIGSTPRELERRNDLSRWDTRALASLLHDLGRESSRLQYRIEDVLRHFPEGHGSLDDQDWYRLIKDPDGPSLISIGSPRACLASEVMLAEIFGVEPFGEGGSLSRTAPFHFVWPLGDVSELRSSFALDVDELAALEPKVSEAVRRSESRAMHWRNEVFRIEQRPEGYREFGVIVAQRRSSGRVFLVCSGISGPTTLAAARLVKDVAVGLPRPVLPGAHGSPVMALVSADVGIRPDAPRGDDRILVRQEINGEPVIFLADD